MIYNAENNLVPLPTSFKKYNSFVSQHSNYIFYSKSKLWKPRVLFMEMSPMLTGLKIYEIATNAFASGEHKKLALITTCFMLQQHLSPIVYSTLACLSHSLSSWIWLFELIALRMAASTWDWLNPYQVLLFPGLSVCIV